MRAGVLVFAFGLAGCQSILGLDEPRLVDAGVDQAEPDAPLDANLVQGCPSSFMTLTNSGNPGSQTRYSMLAMSLSFSEAAQACAMFPTSAGRHTHLVVFNDDNELSAVNQAFSSAADSDTRWIGLSTTVNGKLMWVTDEPITGYPPASGTPWALGEPDGGLEQCVAMKQSASLTGALEDLACTTMLRPICECDGYADDPTHY